ncbi:Cytochrome P450 [Macleaya cordata]|uniref:Cytochrome P450 n=1 Tax=Macleaya cordata TaxID=56857 RepID=A0A200PM77_MACCD|nr:Cytochrome P450 [Macleaya cordata]
MEYFELLLASLEYQFWLELVLAFLCFFFIIWYVKHKNDVVIWWPVVGAIPSLLRNAHRVHDWTVEVSNTIGTTIVERGTIFARLNLLYTCDPNIVEYMVKTNFANYPKGPEYIDMFEVLGHGIFTVDFEPWHAQRRLANVTFASKDFRSYIGKVSKEVVQDSLLPFLEHVAKQSTTTVDLEDVFLRFAFDSIFTVVFGKNPNYLAIDLPNNVLAKAIDDATEAVFYRHILPRPWWKLCNWLMVGKERKLAEAIRVINEHLGKYVSAKRKDLIEGVGGGEGGGNNIDLLEIYMTSHELQKNDLLPKDDEFLKDTGLNFIFAGRDSTGTSLAWFFWLIATNPSVESKILEELKLLFSKNMKENHHSTNTSTRERRPWVFNSEDLKGLVYLHAALCESLRLYPPLPLNRKGVHKEDVLPDGTVVKPGMKVLISMYAMGRMEWLWGKDCLEYKPERWIGEDGKLSHEPKSKFYTFNAGPRNCVGKEMAFTQLKLVAANVIFNFHVEMVEGHIVCPKPSAVLHMKNGLMVRVKEREIIL